MILNARTAGVLLWLTCGTAYPQEPHTIKVWPNEAKLNDVVNIQIDNVAAFVAAAGAGKTPVYVPYLGDIPLRGSRLESFDKNRGILSFTLLRGPDATSRDAWNHVLGNFGGQANANPKPLLSVGVDGVGPIQSNGAQFTLIVFPEPQSPIALIILALLIVGLLALALRTDILKDPAPAAGGRVTWSLARCQMAWWTLIVLASFVVIYLVTGDLTVPASSLVLLGISAATGLTAVKITPTSTPEKQANPTGFFRDLLWENGAPTLHRFQLLAWTLILGLIFIFQVVNNLAQPVLDATLLTLMGISSGTYIGFKFN
jgi:hypothetical protein